MRRATLIQSMIIANGEKNMAKGSQGVRDAFGYLLENELPAFKHVVNALPPNSLCINIGAGSGTSALAFLECNTVGTLYTIDIQAMSRPEGGLGNETAALKESGYWGDPRYHQICGDSTEVGKIWKGGLVDMVFIDGDHSYEHCLSDIEAWLPHIKYGGVMALHDYLADVWPGVKKSADEVLSRYSVINHTQTFIAYRIK